MTKNFTHETDHYDNTLTITVPGYWDVDLSDEQIIWGNLSEYEKLQDNIIDEYVAKTFGHIYSEQNRMVAKIAGFDIVYEYCEYDNRELKVVITVHPQDDETDIDDHPEFINSIIASLDIGEESWYEVQEDQFSWWCENGCSYEDEMQVARIIDAGYIFTHSNPDSNWFRFDTFQEIEDATQQQVDEYIANDIENNDYIDERWYEDVRQAVEKHGFAFNFEAETA